MKEMGKKILFGGSVAAAIAASLCCIGPFVAVVLGLSTFSAAALFEAWRPYLIGLTVLMLAGAFYLTYRKREVQCEGGACQMRSASRASKIMLWLATIAVIAFTTFPYYYGALLRAQAKDNAPGAVSQAASQVANQSEAKVVIAVSGMTCDGCAAHIQSELVKMPGVRSAEVSYKKGQAVVAYDPSATNLDAIRNTINTAGYKAGEIVR
jgi:copper chaperone CopZ